MTFNFILIAGAVGLPFPGVFVQIVPPNQDGNIDLKKYANQSFESEA